jgi:hypothetical protein
VPNGSAPHLELPASGRLLPCSTLAVHHRAPLRTSRGLLRWLPPPARGLPRQLFGCPGPSLQRAPPRGWYFPRPRPLSTEDIRISLPRWPRLLREEACICAVYSPSTMLASGNVASTAGASVSAWGMGADSSAAGAKSSSAIAALGSTSSRSSPWISCIVHNWLSTKYDYQTTCTTWEKDLYLQARLDHCHGWGAKYAGDIDKSSFSRRLLFGFSSRCLLSWRGLGCGFSQPAPPQSPSCLHPLGLRGRKVESPASNRILLSAYTTSKNKYSITLLEDFTSWDVVSVTLSCLATRLRATLRGFLGGAGKLASKVVGGSWMRGTLGSPGRLNLDHSWNRS